MPIARKERTQGRNQRLNSISKSRDLLSPTVIGRNTVGAVRSAMFVATLGRSLL